MTQPVDGSNNMTRRGPVLSGLKPWIDLVDWNWQVMLVSVWGFFFFFGLPDRPRLIKFTGHSTLTTGVNGCVCVCV